MHKSPRIKRRGRHIFPDWVPNPRISVENEGKDKAPDPWNLILTSCAQRRRCSLRGVSMLSPKSSEVCRSIPFRILHASHSLANRSDSLGMRARRLSRLALEFKPAFYHLEFVPAFCHLEFVPGVCPVWPCNACQASVTGNSCKRYAQVGPWHAISPTYFVYSIPSSLDMSDPIYIFTPQDEPASVQSQP